MLWGLSGLRGLYVTPPQMRIRVSRPSQRRQAANCASALFRSFLAEARQGRPVHPGGRRAPTRGVLRGCTCVHQLGSQLATNVICRRLKSGSMLLADRGYDADWIREPAVNKGAWATRRRAIATILTCCGPIHRQEKARLREPTGVDAVKRFSRSVQSGPLEVRIAA
jgi:hypothetical protein